MRIKLINIEIQDKLPFHHSITCFSLQTFIKLHLYWYKFILSIRLVCLPSFCFQDSCVFMHAYVCVCMFVNRVCIKCVYLRDINLHTLEEDAFTKMAAVYFVQAKWLSFASRIPGAIYLKKQPTLRHVYENLVPISLSLRKSLERTFRRLIFLQFFINQASILHFLEKLLFAGEIRKQLLNVS